MDFFLTSKRHENDSIPAVFLIFKKPFKISPTSNVEDKIIRQISTLKKPATFHLLVHEISEYLNHS